MLRVDNVIQPPGLIANGQTCTLIYNESKDELYIIKVGPAGRDMNVRGAANKAAVNWAHDRIAKKVQEGLQKLDNTPLEELLKEKQNKIITRGDIQDIQFKENMMKEPIMKLKTSKGKFTFNFNKVSQTDREAIGSKLHQ